jgi:hypothetical protein
MSFQKNKLGGMGIEEVVKWLLYLGIVAAAVFAIVKSVS